VLRIEIGGRTIWQVIGAILATLALLRAAGAARSLLSMVALSFFFSLALDPAVRWLRGRYGWRRGAAVGVIYLAGMAFVAFMIFVLVPAIQTLADTVAERADVWLANLNAWTNDRLGFPVTTDAVAADATGIGSALGSFSEDAFGTVLGIASAGVSLVFNLATIAMFTFYFTADAPRIKRAVLRLFSPKAQERIGWTWDQAIVQTGGYFYSRMVLMAINGIGFFATMVIVGVPVALALPLALFGGFVSVFIPAIGTYIGSAIPVLITLAIQGLVPALVVLGYALVYQQVENYWLSPKISANTMSLNGGVAFGAALAGGAIAGPMGAFVALPVAALISSTISNYARSHEIVYRSEFDDAAPDQGGEPESIAETVAAPTIEVPDVQPTTGSSPPVP
jgi:predicted PurR-regulated permease PerM